MKRRSRAIVPTSISLLRSSKAILRGAQSSTTGIESASPGGSLPRKQVHGAQSSLLQGPLVRGAFDMNILLVDDQNVVREALAYALTSQPGVSEVVQAASGQEALRAQ